MSHQWPRRGLQAHVCRIPILEDNVQSESRSKLIAKVSQENLVVTHNGAHEGDAGKWDGIEFLRVGGSRALLTGKECTLQRTQHYLTFKTPSPGLSVLTIKQTSATSHPK